MSQPRLNDNSCQSWSASEKLYHRDTETQKPILCASREAILCFSVSPCLCGETFWFGESRSMKIAILGAGAVGRATAAVLCSRSHEAILWSPSGRSTMAFAAGEALAATGALSGTFHPTVAAIYESAIAAADVVLLALPCEAHRKILDMIAPLIRPDQIVIISSHC